ncbi:MAG: hypothetical protein RRZ24_06990 [Clostridia bacterium]
MKKAFLILSCAAILLLLLAFIGCDNAVPQVTGTPTPSASPTPLPDAFHAEITAEPQPTDLLGNVIYSENHYFQFLSFGDLRVYEYDDGTFLDGVCVNAYPTALDGRVDIVYYTDTGKICGQGTIHNASGSTQLETGTNSIYAEISTDIDVRMMDFVWDVKTFFLPVEQIKLNP